MTANGLNLVENLWLMVSLPLFFFGLGWMLIARALPEFQRGLLALGLFNLSNGVALLLICFVHGDATLLLFAHALTDILVLLGFLQLWSSVGYLFQIDLDRQKLVSIFAGGSLLLLALSTGLTSLHYRIAMIMALMAWCSFGIGFTLIRGATDETKAWFVTKALRVTAVGMGIVLLVQACRGVLLGLSPGVVQSNQFGLGLTHFLMSGAFAANLLFAVLLVGKVVRRLHDLSYQDELTGLPNRRAIMEAMDQEWVRYDTIGEPISLVTIDLDHFKKVNDLYGHLAGDVVLAKTAQLMEAQIRSSDVLARSGGEEFILMLPGTELARAKAIAERVCRAVSDEEGLHPNPDQHISVSVGVACVGNQDNKLDNLLARSDAALYRAKAAGRDQVAVDSELGFAV